MASASSADIHEILEAGLTVAASSHQGIEAAVTQDADALCPKMPNLHTFFKQFFLNFFFLVEMVNLGLVYIKINLITLDHSKNWEKNMVLWL